MGTVAFVCAMPMELRPLTKRLGLRTSTIGGVEVRTGRLGAHAVVATVTGMGTKLATKGTERLLEAVIPDHVLVVGITRAVDDTPIGTLIVPEVVVDGPTGREHRPHPLGGGVPQGTMWTTDVITPPEQLPELRARGVVCLDMETAAIAHCCERRGIPWSVFRAISDRADDGSVDEETFHLSNQDGTPNGRAVVRYILRHPRRIPNMASLARARQAGERTSGHRRCRGRTDPRLKDAPLRSRCGMRVAPALVFYRLSLPRRAARRSFS